MSTKIAVIGPSDFIKKIIAVADEIYDIEIDPYIYQEPQEAAQLVKNLKPCDAAFFTGALPYYFSKESLERLSVPALFLAQDEMAVAASILSILYNKKISPTRISIDLFDSSIVTKVLADSEITDQPVWVMDYRQMLEGQFDLAKIVRYHENLWKQGAIDLALTSVHAVYDRLLELGIPAKRMSDPKTSLIRGLQNAKDQADLFKSKSAQVAVCYISRTDFHTQHQEQIDTFAVEIHATIQELNKTTYVLYSTRGDIETLLEQNSLHDFFTKWPNSANVGFGFGSTIKEADQNAMVALSFAEKEAGEKCGYILTEEKELLGPFPHEYKQQRLKNDNPEFLQVAKQTKLSPANLSKIMEFSKSRQSLQFTAADLADYLQVTRRSTERILKKLVDHGHVKIVGEEMTYQQGRPRAIYELNMPVYH